MFGERVLFPYCPSFLGVWWKCPISPLGCPGPCPLSLSVPVLSLIVIYCPVLSLYWPLIVYLTFILSWIVLCIPILPSIVPYFPLLPSSCPIFSLSFLFVPIQSPLLFVLCPILYYPLSIDPIIDIYFRLRWIKNPFTPSGERHRNVCSQNSEVHACGEIGCQNQSVKSVKISCLDYKWVPDPQAFLRSSLLSTLLIYWHTAVNLQCNLVDKQYI